MLTLKRSLRQKAIGSGKIPVHVIDYESMQYGDSCREKVTVTELSSRV